MQTENGLVFTAKKNTWFKDKTNLFLGDWCLKEDGLSNYENLNFKVSDLEKNQKDKKKILKKVEICDYYYQRLLKDSILNLKKYYAVNWNERSWEIFLGPFLHRYVAIIYDKHQSLKYVIENYKINHVKLTNFNNYSLLTFDREDFIKKLNSDDWNLILFSLLWNKYFDQNNLVSKTFVDTKNEVKYKYAENVKEKIDAYTFVKNLFLKPLEKFFCSKNKFLLYKTYFGKKKLVLKLLKETGTKPFPYDLKFKIKKKFFVSNFRESLFKSYYSDLDKFEKILRELIFQILPTFYIEEINNLKYLDRKLLLPKNIKAIYTSTGLWEDSLFKFWLSESISKNTKLVYSQHGCAYGSTLYMYSEYLEKKVSDIYLNWGWEPDAPNVKRFYSIKLINRQKSKKINSKKILIIIAAYYQYTLENHTHSPWGRFNKIYSNAVENIIKKIPKNKIKLFHIRPYPNEKAYDCNFSNILQKKFPEIVFQDVSKNLLNCIDEYGIIINTREGTNFLELMALNKPNLLIIASKNENFGEYRENVKNYYKRLEEVSIIHKSEESISNFLSKIENNYNDWWFSEEVQAARRDFCKNFVNTSNKTISELTNILNSTLKS